LFFAKFQKRFTSGVSSVKVEKVEMS